MKKWLFILGLMAELLCGAQDFGTGMEVTGFRVPDYDEQGQLRAQLYGGHAKVLEGRVVEITNLKIDMYRDGAIAMTVFSPHCFFNMESRKAWGSDEVLLESDMMTVVGKGFTWSSEVGSFEILEDSKVLVKEAAQAGMKEMSL